MGEDLPATVQEPLPHLTELLLLAGEAAAAAGGAGGAGGQGGQEGHGTAPAAKHPLTGGVQEPGIGYREEGLEEEEYIK